ncbi:pectin lyase fold/virulence factor [Podospora australis]|uniref:pectinesterase n=1 Tax=Podospora australis TaxID=1536484 RepID=A0AAN6WSL0_9PEZI|nr:pectin lyase fold/virulence factor [Podospora australis]
MYSLVLLLPLLGLSHAAQRTSPPSGCIVVAKSSSQAPYTSIQAAVNSLSTTSTTRQCIFIYPGTYNEQVLVPARKAQLTIYGSTTDDTSYKSNTVLITQKKSQASGTPNNDETGTLRVKSDGFKLYNVDVENSYGKGSQAVALSAYADSGYYGCRLRGYQDTVLANKGKQFYGKSEIVGVTDFIFGQDAPAWFEKVDVRVLAASLGYITASGRSSSSSANYYVFNNCNIAAASGNSVSNGAFYLGRPWREYARVVFQRTQMSAVINSAGWRIWNTGDERISNVEFGEYGNSGTGASGTRAWFSKKLSQPVAIETVLGSGYASAAWYDATYMK